MEKNNRLPAAAQTRQGTSGTRRAIENVGETCAGEDTPAWARSLMREMLDHWQESADGPTGLFHPYLDRQWRRTEGGALTLVTQCRLIYNFCRGYELFGAARDAETARRGLRALDGHFHAGAGHYRWAVARGGGEVDPTPDAYGHAFVILALSTAARAFGEPTLAGQAWEAWEFVSRKLADKHGGLRWRGTDTAERGRSQNPLMHLFEALLALAAVDASGQAVASAGKLLGFVRCLPHFEAGRLIENYTDDWRPRSIQHGGVVDLGHAFEWAWLLSEWHRQVVDAGALVTGAAFLKTGLEWGQEADGGVRASCGPDGRSVDEARGLWQQCEAVRAIRRYGVGHERSELGGALERALAFFRAHFVDGEYGGVFLSPPGLGQTPCLDKGSAWKLDYHTVGMCLELLGPASGTPHAAALLPTG